MPSRLQNQMISNMVGLAAGLEFSKALGAVVGPGQANWTAASYPSVLPLSRYSSLDIADSIPISG
ncbi:hypothetical protein V1506DRAFT_545238 [Lipomyces tetrasporus]